MSIESLMLDLGMNVDFNGPSSWVLDGQKITGTYCGVTVTGLVVDSRVKYGGEVQYTVESDTPVNLPWRSEPRTRLLIDRKDLIGVQNV